jgi:iron complex outermembrane receptor protein
MLRRCLIGSVLAIIVTSSHAADELPASVALEEVTVTAQRREESLLSVPIAVTAITGDQLQKLGIQNFADYAREVPNLAYGYGGGSTGGGYGFSNTREVVIRGVSGQNTTSLYIDDTPVPSVIDPRVLDLERVEVLRGPQGTLFGASSMGGTVRLITRQPNTHEATGQITAQGFDVAHGGAGYDVSGSANIPLISDTLAVRVAAFYDSTPGYLKKEIGEDISPPLTFLPGTRRNGVLNHVGKNEEYGGLASLRFTPPNFPGLSTTLTVIGQKTTSDGLPATDTFGGADPAELTQHRALNLSEGYDDSWEFLGLSGRYKQDYGSFIASVSYFRQSSTDNQDGSNWVAYCQVAFASAGFCPAVGYSPSPTTQDNVLSQVTSEVRFESSFEGPLNFVSGVFFQRVSDNRAIVQATPGLDAASGGLYGTDLFFTSDGFETDKQYAGFLDLTLRPISQVELSAGLRKAHFDIHQYLASGGYFGFGNGNARDATESPLTKRFVARYTISDRNMVYASASEGFRSGGESDTIGGPCAGDLTALGLPTDRPVPYTSDSLWSYEVGTKNAFADNRLTTRLAAYYINWKNIQQALVLPTCGFSITANAGAAAIKGAELEADARVTDHLSFSLGAGYTDAAISKSEALPGGETAGFAVGQPLSNVPRWTGSLRSDYSIPLAGGKGFVRLSYNYVGSSISFANGEPGYVRPSYAQLDGRIGVDADQWDVALYVKNATDKRGILGDVTDIVGIIPGIRQVMVIQPRTIGIEIQHRFGGGH